ncbi:MAG: SMC-Scp complex subunit ScpB [Clostridia bacterium]|nr:SMC-Scp complex subunit ScpB [Clostridia bacterium]
MTPEKLSAAIEAVLFASGAPLEKDRMKTIFGFEDEELLGAIELLKKKYDGVDCGIMLIEVENAYQLCTKSEFSNYIKQALELRKVPPLSKASLEVLAITAYNQPVTRSFIEQVRGIDSASIVNSLCDKGLIAERGYLDAPGRPVLFCTTDAFLRCFGLSSIDELPETDVLFSLQAQKTMNEFFEEEESADAEAVVEV